ncbi:hypothetical protein F5050DRAFT_1116164 [Lentinula boryana]|uniref:Uncharacterized protein n=1 Tax=Lentinula boryana TaxID=40481 RepID=A0ABQ8QKA3_9AGAR|nr:hypothetical protein F5050DRAFT_1116164 [Lentinula boryana]
MQRKFLPSSLFIRAHPRVISLNSRYPVKGLRFVSSSTSSNSRSSFSARTTTFFALGSALIGGLLGFSFAYGPRSSVSAPPTSLSTKTVTKLQYGSAEDFQKAIEELKRTFPDEDTVSTNPEDVYNHGFSVNDYHPGALTVFLSIFSN